MLLKTMLLNLVTRKQDGIKGLETAGLACWEDSGGNLSMYVYQVNLGQFDAI